MSDPHVETAPLRPGDLSSSAGFTKREVTIGTAGVALGIVIGVVLSIGVASVVNAAQSLTAGSPMSDAATACDVPETSPWIVVGDGGRSISMKSDGEESQGADLGQVMCVLAELDTPDSVISLMDSTRALDGRQAAEWKNLSASWGYHPDDGLDVVVEVVTH
jgi:hypothetical protein